jgi:hypothetical protein
MLYNVSFRGRCARMGNTIKLPSPTKLYRLGHFTPASRAGRLAGPVFNVYVFSLMATSWRHEGKISPGWRGCGVHAHSLTQFLPQSRQSARFSLVVRIGSFRPLTRKRVLPTPLWSQEGAGHIRLREREWGEPVRKRYRADTHPLFLLYSYMYSVTIRIYNNALTSTVCTLCLLNDLDKKNTRNGV